MIPDETLVKYRRFLKRCNYSAHTIKTDMNTLEHFRRWLPLPLEEVTSQEISAYIDFLLAHHSLSPLRRRDFITFPQVLAQPHLFFFNKIWIISNLVDWSNPFPCCPGKKAGSEAKKGREKPSKFPPLRFRNEARWQRNSRAETAEARIGKRGTTAFFGEAHAFLPGHGTLWP